MFCVYTQENRLVQTFKTEAQALAYIREWRIKAGYNMHLECV